MTITHQILIDSSGTPAWAVIPWSDFVRIRELLEGGEASGEEAIALRHAETERRALTRSTFTDAVSSKDEIPL